MSDFADIVAAMTPESGVTYKTGRGFGANALKVDGRIFAMMSSAGHFVVKLPTARVAERVAAGQGEFFDAGRGRVMKEWLALEAPSLPLAREAFEFVRRAAAASDRMAPDIGLKADGSLVRDKLN